VFRLLLRGSVVVVVVVDSIFPVRFGWGVYFGGFVCVMLGLCLLLILLMIFLWWCWCSDWLSSWWICGGGVCGGWILSLLLCAIVVLRGSSGVCGVCWLVWWRFGWSCGAMV